MHAIILAGGFGTRLRTVVSDVPKPLAPIGAKPFLAWLIESLASQGVTGVTLSVHHEWEKIRDYFQANPAPIPLSYAVEDKPLGTGGAMAYAMREAGIQAPVLVVNGDTFVKADIAAFYKLHVKAGAEMSMVLRAVEDTGRYGQVLISGGVVTAFQPGKAGQAGYINAGVYVLSPSIFEKQSVPEAFSFEQDFMQPYVGTLKPRSFIADDYFIDIGIPDDYARACMELPKTIMGLKSL
jgi:D-glycero-alpha-D-manno-heptose 1-phosphate guanylyltransferase